jgi:two-component system chemotaxis response regulator CheY
VPAELDAVFQKTLAKVPAERFQSMAALAAALEAIHLDPQQAAGPVLLSGFPVGGTAGARPTIAGGALRSEGALHTMAVPAMPEAGVTLDLGSNTHSVATNTILLVEPSRTQANIIRKYLQELNYPNVIVATNGQKALEALRATRVYAVVSAVHLDDMSGAELLRSLRGELKQTEVGYVAITSSTADSTELTAFRGAPRAALLAKPFDRDKLRLALSAATAPTAQAPASLASSSSNPQYASLRVLLVDDSGAVRAHVRGILAGLGFRHIAEVSDGTEAIAQLTQHPFDLVVTDYNMPLMDGRALTGYIRQRSTNPTVPILMITAETDPGKLEEARKLGVSEFCAKTFKPEVVREVLARILGR